MTFERTRIGRWTYKPVESVSLRVIRALNHATMLLATYSSDVRLLLASRAASTNDVCLPRMFGAIYQTGYGRFERLARQNLAA
jgi:hypothetical protein